MKKIFESDFHGDGESAEKIYVYEFDNDDEYWAFDDMNHQERCDVFNVHDDNGYFISPGAIYHNYYFDNSVYHVTMTEVVGYNV